MFKGFNGGFLAGFQLEKLMTIRFEGVHFEKLREICSEDVSVVSAYSFIIAKEDFFGQERFLSGIIIL